MVAQIKYLIFAFLLCNILSKTCAETKAKQRINIILLGATGDLAKRYLWRGFFNLYSSVVRKDNSFKTGLHVYGAARLDNEAGSKTIMDILKTSITCSSAECNKIKADFMKVCHYHRLKSAQDFDSLQKLLGNNAEMEIGRIFYLSVPPFAYQDISKNIAEKCRPTSDNTWVRVVLEKPFGSDLNSAKDLAEKLSKYWQEHEIYRIDHYLGKAGVSQIMEFKKENRVFFENMWNADNVERVDIVVKESLDAKGRMKFYNQYGVIRDVFQNHLTEILALVAMEIPKQGLKQNFEKTLGNSAHISSGNYKKPSQDSAKSDILRSAKTIILHDAVFGQYENYNEQLKQEVSGIKIDSNVPTFAAVLMAINNKRWMGVPFVLVSGKSLDCRLAYVQLKFKQSKFCIKNKLNSGHEGCEDKTLTFYIQGEGNAGYPLTVVSKSLHDITFSVNWENVTDSLEMKSKFSGENVVMRPPITENDAYSSLIKEVYMGNKEPFVSVDDLLLSWQIWDPLIGASSLIKPRLYTQESVESLDFEILNGKINFVAGYDSKFLTSKTGRLQSFRGNRLVSDDWRTVVQKLASDIIASIQTKILSTDKVFHLALSGGSTSKHLFQVLSQVKYIPWESVHIWLVDERCVNFTNEESNFKNIYVNLLNYVPIPYVNIHPMSVNVAGEFCRPVDLGDKYYEKQLRQHLVNGSLDFVVLGVGTDGHTASLFPGSDSLASTNWVELTSSSGSSKRMTMTHNVLNRAKNIAVLVLGERKREIVKKLAQGFGRDQRLPITLVDPVRGSLVWYIDDVALDYATVINV